MSIDEIRLRVRKFISEDLQSEGIEFQNETTLFENGIIDSIGIIRLMAFLEDTFHISISPIEVMIDNFNTVNKISDFVLQKIEK